MSLQNGIGMTSTIESILNPDPHYVGQMFSALLRKDLHCPCQVPPTAETLCICKTFQDMIADETYQGECPCGLWIKREIQNESQRYKR